MLQCYCVIVKGRASLELSRLELGHGERWRFDRFRLYFRTLWTLRSSPLPPQSPFTPVGGQCTDRLPSSQAKNTKWTWQLRWVPVVPWVPVRRWISATALVSPTAQEIIPVIHTIKKNYSSQKWAPWNKDFRCIIHWHHRALYIFSLSCNGNFSRGQY